MDASHVGREARFRIDSKNVAHETIDDETIVLQFERGNYFSLKGSAPEIWRQLARGLTLREATLELARRHRIEPSAIEADVEGFANRLVSEALLEHDGRAGPGGAVDRGAREATAGSEASSGDQFERPEIEKYTDMQDFLLVDPIHEVTTAGWPTVKPPAPHSP
jgi:hypothetical protein